jgi:hypothetical protein
MKKLFITVFAFAALGCLGGWPRTASAQNTRPINMQMNAKPTSVRQLLSGQGTNMIGQQVTLNEAQVRSTTDKHAAWLGPNDGEKILVLMPGDLKPMNPNGKQTEMGENDLVDITGTVEAAPSANQLKHAWGVNEDNVGRVQRAGIVIRASRITVQEHR